MFPPIQPYATGHLSVGDGSEIYWECSGNPAGTPALYLHGGPGGGLGQGYRRRFDPEIFRIISFEQRGCGRSRPKVTVLEAALETNTTQALIADIEALRRHFDVERWLVCGISWGTTLALAYAQAHPERVTAIALLAVTTTSPEEVAWTTEEMRRLMPQQWDHFASAAPRRSGQRLVDAYYERITSDDPDVRSRAALAWCQWEDAHMSFGRPSQPDPSFDDPDFCQVFATLVIHYWKHGAFLEPGAILAGMTHIADIPGVLIHGRLDVSCPVETSWDLHRAWPASEWLVIDDEGHGGERMFEELSIALSRLARSC